MMTGRNQRRLFYVVQFIELPFEGIDDYVCVPYSWVIVRKTLNRKIVVTYPNNEDPFETRERVKRKERPNDEWRFYMAYLKYESDDFEAAEFCIARNKYGPVEKEQKKKDTKPESELNRSVNQSCWSETNSDEPQVTVKPYNNPRKPLPRISIRRPLSQKPDQNLNNKCLKVNENASASAAGSSKQEQSIIITGNQVIQKNQRKTNYASNVEPEVIKENQSVDLSVQSTSAKLSVEHQLSPQLPTEQQLSLHSPTGREPSSQPPIDRQLSLKFIAKRHSSPNLSEEKQPLPVGQDYQQPVSMSAVDLDESDGEIDICQNVLPEPVTDERPSTKTPPRAFKPVPQLVPINERPTPLVLHEHSRPEPHSRDVAAGQSKEPNDCQKTYLPYNIVPRSPSTTNQINQPIQFLPQNGNQYVPINSAYPQEVKSHELMKRCTDRSHVIYKAIAPKEVNIQVPAHYLSSQSHQDAEHPQKKQDQQNYQDPHTIYTQNGLPLKSTRSSLISKPQKGTKKSRSPSTSKTKSQALLDAQRSCLIQELGIQERVNQIFTKSNNTNLAAISENQTVELASSTENTEVQTMPSCNQIQATQFTLLQNKHACQCQGMKKTMIDQATETDSMMDVSHHVETIAGSSIHESASRAVKSVFQTDEWMQKEQKSFYKEIQIPKIHQNTRLNQKTK